MAPNLALAPIPPSQDTPDPTSFAAARMLLMRCPDITGDYLRAHADSPSSRDVAAAIDVLRPVPWTG
jgi:hypothetical protein